MVSARPGAPRGFGPFGYAQGRLRLAQMVTDLTTENGRALEHWSNMARAENREPREGARGGGHRPGGPLMSRRASGEWPPWRRVWMASSSWRVWM